MIVAIADTHTAIWYLFADARLSIAAKDAIETAAAQGDHIGISAISLAEIFYLIERGRIASDTLSRLQQTLRHPGEVLTEVPVDSRMVEAMQMLPPDEVADLPDRIIGATALALHVPVISRDRQIRASSLDTIW
jgi:PIN domain nuclease of toxin-antitoxin system